MDVAVSGNHAYCLRQKGEMEILDISDPTAPKRTGYYRTASTYPREITVSGHYVFISDGSGIIHVLDAIDPRSPKQIAYLKGAWGYNGIAAHQHRLYVAGAHRFYVVDISNPGTPRRLAYHNLKRGDTGIAVAIKDNHAYMAAEYWNGSQSNTRLYVFKLPKQYHNTYDDKDNKDNNEKNEKNEKNDAVRLLATLEMDVDIRKMMPAANHIFLAGMKDGLVTVDISQPAAPQIVNRFPVNANVLDVFVSGSLAYLACDRSGLKVIDIADPANPVALSNFHSGGYGSGIHVTRRTAFLVDARKGIVLIDTALPQALQLLYIYPH